MTRSMSSPIMRVSILMFSRGHVVEVDDARSQHLLAAEGQKLAGQRRGAFGGARDLLRRSAQVRLGAQSLQQELRVARESPSAGC